MGPAVDPPDGGWGWVIVGAVFVSGALTHGAVTTYPLFFLPLMQEFGVGLGVVTWLTGLHELGKGFGFLLTPVLFAWFGHRGTALIVSCMSGVAISIASFAPTPVITYIFAGAIPGIAVGVSGALFFVIIVRYFVKRRLLAVGLSQTGSAFGTLVLSPVLQHWINLYGWRGGMLLMGGLTLNSVVASSLYRPIRLKTDQSSEHVNSRTAMLASAKQTTKIPKFWLVVLTCILAFGGFRIYLQFIIPYMQEQVQVDAMASSIVLSVYSIVSMVSRVAFGALGDRMNVLWLLIVSELITAVTTALAWFATSYTGVIVNSIAHSIFTGTIHSMYVPVIIDAVGEQNFTWGATIIGFLTSGVGSVFVPLVGMLVDATGEIRHAFICSAVMMTTAALLHFPLLYPKPQSEENENDTA